MVRNLSAPGGSIYSTIMELGPKNHNGDGLLGQFCTSRKYGPSGVGGRRLVSVVAQQSQESFRKFGVPYSL